jgi:hypothetical protein
MNSIEYATFTILKKIRKPNNCEGHEVVKVAGIEDSKDLVKGIVSLHACSLFFFYLHCFRVCQVGVQSFSDTSSVI